MSRLAGLILRVAALALFFLALLLTPQQASAKVVSYKITDGFSITPTGPIGVGRVFYDKSVTLQYVRGKMLLSSTPDGEGAMRIGDLIQAYASYPGSGSYTYRAKPDCVTGSSILPPVDITNLFFTGFNNNTNSITVRFSSWCAGEKIISPIYLVNIDDSDKPKPFLDLPWEYEKKGLSFNTAATAINSYFDHEYPFLSIGKSHEPASASGTIVGYQDSLRKTRPYSSHDGYDYGSPAKVEYRDNMLAAATGSAEYINTCGPCGNAIHIDHGNGYQTRYYHLDKEGLIIATPGASIQVEKGQVIGKVGFTGNVDPKNEDGAHIHFMVVYDKNADGDFEDNIPDGLVDPFGWQSKDPDPWENYAFSYLGSDRTGMKSTYLWTTPLSSKHVAIPNNGGSVAIGKNKIVVPATANSNKEFELKAFLTSVVPPNFLFGVLGPGTVINAFDVLGNAITSFSTALTLTIDFAEIDLSRYDPETISLYSSQDGENWVKEELTSIDMQNKTATAQISHLTHFALMAERIDTVAPTTGLSIDGRILRENVYLPDLELSLEATDGAGLGVDYTAYSLDGGEWLEYTEPLTISEEGEHEVRYFSVDNDENIEDQQVKTFTIERDMLPPVTAITLSGDILNGTTYRSDVQVSFTASDSDGVGVDHISYNLDNNSWEEYELPVSVSDQGEHTVQYYSVDTAGNIETSREISFTIQKIFDEIQPEISMQFDSSTRTFVYSASDSSGAATLTQSSPDQNYEKLVATDEANNSLAANLTKSQSKFLSVNTSTISVESLQYNTQQSTELDGNSLSVLYSVDRQGKLNLLTQAFVSKTFGSVVLYCDFKKNQTTILETQGGKLITKKLSGMKMLQLSTNSGRLEYRY